MNELIKHQQFGEIRIVTDKGEPWFVAKDVCRILSITNDRNVVSRLDEDEVRVSIVQTPSGKQEMNLVNESGLYNIIFQSRKPSARKFRKWVTGEVLPAIRKWGYYSTEPGKMDRAIRKAEAKAQKELFEEIGKRISESDRRLVGKQCLTNEYEVNRVLRCDKEDVYMATLLYNRAKGNMELHSRFYTKDGADELKKLLMEQSSLLI